MSSNGSDRPSEAMITLPFGLRTTRNACRMAGHRGPPMRAGFTRWLNTSGSNVPICCQHSSRARLLASRISSMDAALGRWNSVRGCRLNSSSFLPGRQHPKRPLARCSTPILLPFLVDTTTSHLRKVNYDPPSSSAESHFYRTLLREGTSRRTKQ